MASAIERSLAQYEVPCYLDKTDGLLQSVAGDPRELTAHLNEVLGRCATLLVVASDKTRESWWVPYEIGFLRAHDRPVAVFDCTDSEPLPEYLAGWPVLWSEDDIPEYVGWFRRLLRKLRIKDRLRKGLLTEGEMQKVAGQTMSAHELEDDLKHALGRG